MLELNEHLVAHGEPLANDSQIFIKGPVRITVLTPSVLRVEYSEDSKFNDASTQIVWYRNLGEYNYTVEETKKQLIVKTDDCEFRVNKKKGKVDSVVLDGAVICCNNKKNLKGTTRTLDMTFGKTKLYNGIIGSNGVAVMRDDTLILDENGMFKLSDPRNDTYVFASKDYKASLNTFFKLTGMPPLIPRYALGNWWSRYHEYTQSEYMGVMKKFESEGIPISVATIDMDWHWVNIENEFGSEYKRVRGWTGYSWNTKYFPDYRLMFKELKKMGLKISLNLHPADGVRSYESMYREMCNEMGLDHTTNKPVPFDFTDENFINAYFKVLHNPYEDNDGVDVWWIDWQQGKKSKIKGYDPLWGLNHFHFLDASRNGKRPFILSRYGGLGSHRYPVGFSGDTAITWRVLKFQPYFTATAANAGYITWSHDIGGHHLGAPNDEELYLRWVQFGVFSPIFRLHSTKAVRSKEPWTFEAVYPDVKRQLIFRHKLIPYIYTTYHRAYSEGRAICEPLYYRHPNKPEAYNFKNEYYFGENILVAPITISADKSGLSQIDVWLPDEKKYVDIFTGEVYMGGKIVNMRRNKTSIPVLITEGTILPLAVCENNSIDNPKAIEILVVAGNGSFTLYEDDGITDCYKNGDYVETLYTIKLENDTMTFEIESAKGNVNLIPKERDYEIIFKDLVSYKTVDVSCSGRRIKYSADTNSVGVGRVDTSSKLTITLTEVVLA
ncbi:MAG: glycoside hydrolase family 31 protein [Christensenellaceae bacterium]|jgi:alpha-glucosidase (family GH31 glycosyl hydrolase)|nr:glycoside hydrolase family 31 protein [Christensenellaceae bacterium]